MPPITGEYGFHIFLSHVWRWAQDQVATIKGMLATMLPGARCFLDVDNLDDIAKLEEYIAESEVILVLLTRDYISSKNCRRELVHTFELEKPLVLLLETDVGHGAPTVDSLKRELDLLKKRPGYCTPEELIAVQRLIRLVECGGFIEWHREKQFKCVCMR